MIPLQLTIEGLYSYQERQSIDFSSLTAAGLFGIFGQVGSGKSSILEAISFALYGETERLNAKEKRAYNMMNLKSKRCYLEFDFLNYEQKKFRVTREFKRNSKNFSDVKATSSVFYEYKNNTWIPVENGNAAQILGLSYANFKRTIIIPQGQFREFLELGAKDRTEMMKEIFNLQRFDLQDKTSRLQRENHDALTLLEGKLSGYEYISEEKIANIKSEEETAEKKLQEIQKVYEKITLDFEKQKSLKNDQEDLKKKKQAFTALQEQEPKMEARYKILQQYENYAALFKPQFELRNSTVQQLRSKEEETQKLEEEYKLLKTQLQRRREIQETLEPAYLKLQEKRKEENELLAIAKIIAANNETETLQKRTEKGRKLAEEIKNLEATKAKEIQKTEEELSVLKKEKPDTEELLQVGAWFSELKNLQQKKAETTQKTEKLQGEKLKISQVLKENKINADLFENEWNSASEEITLKRKTAEEEKSRLRVQQQLAAYTRELHEGTACPLCGSEHHPHPAEIDDVAHLINLANQNLEKLSEAEKLWNTRREIFLKESLKMGNAEKEIQTEKEKENNLSEQILDHYKKFIWKNFSSRDFEGFEMQRKSAHQYEKKILETENRLKEYRTHLEDTRKKLQEYTEALNKLNIELEKKQTEKEHFLQDIKILSFEKFEDKTVQEIMELHENLTLENNELQQTYEKNREEIQQLTTQEAEERTRIEGLKKQISEFEKHAAVVDKKIQELLVAHNTSLAHVEKLLELNLHTEEERKEIEQFRIDFRMLKKQISELGKKLQEAEFKEEDFEKTEEKYNKSTEDLKAQRILHTQVKTELERLLKEFETKKELLSEREKLSGRAENLKTMFNLFKGAGFVQYVSSIYLRQLCDHANVRFHQMTRNQLSLRINENNDFEVMDYLNEGKSRSVKTLSGGQAFQASLSLALALAESVQSQARAGRNFFFIDEGFGTQDSESVNIVFETLSNLQKENRIVGIISHVEELKEKIPLSLNIRKDETRGSLIFEG